MDPWPEGDIVKTGIFRGHGDPDLASVLLLDKGVIIKKRVKPSGCFTDSPTGGGMGPVDPLLFLYRCIQGVVCRSSLLPIFDFHRFIRLRPDKLWLGEKQRRRPDDSSKFFHLPCLTVYDNHRFSQTHFG
jgi:hypothetical protein